MTDTNTTVYMTLDRVRRQAATIDKSDTTWVLISTALVFLMVPGISYFYSGLSRNKNKLSVLMFSLITIGLVSLEWFLWNYSLCFSQTGSVFIGDLKHVALVGVNSEPTPLAPTIPHNCFMIFQCMFACVTGALVFGSGLERSTLRSYIVFMFFWTVFVYDFVAYWVWGLDGWLKKLGVLDFAGGTPVHIVSGFSALAYAIFVGPRKEFRQKDFNTNNGSELYLGTALIWFGWFGFNAGSELTIDSRAANAFVVTNLSASIGGFTWMFTDMLLNRSRKMSVTAFCNGVIAGLVSITPASGFVSPASSLVFGGLAGILCVFTCKIKNLLGYDDAADVFGIHGTAGILGGLLTGIFADKAVADNTIKGGWINQNYIQLLWQLIGVAVGAAWAFVVTSILLLILRFVPYFNLKAPDEDQDRGLDLAEIGEKSFGLDLSDLNEKFSSDAVSASPSSYNVSGNIPNVIANRAFGTTFGPNAPLGGQQNQRPPYPYGYNFSYNNF